MKSIIFNSFLEAVRDRVLIVVLIFGIIMIFVSTIVGPLSLGEDVRIATDIGLMVISLFGLLIILFIGNRSIYRELNEKTCYLTLSRPITRFQFIVGKALGLFLTILVSTSILGVIYLVHITILSGKFQPEIILAILGIIFQLLILTGFTILASTFLNPFIGSIFIIFVYILGQTIPKAIPLALYHQQIGLSIILRIIHRILPDFTYFDFREIVIYHSQIPINRILFAFPYAISYSIVLVLIAALIFERKDL